MKQKIILLLALIILCTAATASAQEAPVYNPTVPSSPQAEHFQRYGQIAVNHSTGAPDIAIPLYEINHRGYTIPVNLRYVAQPLKPGYNYDVFGLGWAFAPIGQISRTIEFLPDEWKNFKIDTEKQREYIMVLSNGITDYNHAHDKFSAILPDGSSFDFAIDNVNGSLQYIISGNRSVKISCNYNSSNINSFTVTDENGVVYTFSGSDTPHSDHKFSRSYVSWHLTRVDLPHSTEPITLAYDYAIESRFNPTFEEPGVLIRHYKDDGYGSGFAHRVESNNLMDYTPTYYKMKLLSSINYGNNRMQLVYQNPATSVSHNYVKQIKVLEGSAVIREINLGMTTKNIPYAGNSTHTIAKLNSVTIKGADTSAEPLTYQCAYLSEGYTNFIGTDHWGYLNQNDIKRSIANFNLFVEIDTKYFTSVLQNNKLSAVTKSSQDLCPFDKIKLSGTNYNNRQPSSPDKHGVLQKVTYPTGGYTEFVFENHKFLTSTTSNGDYIHNPQNKVVTSGGGFRIKKITNYTASGSVAEVKNYRYGKDYRTAAATNNNFAYAAQTTPYLHTGAGEAVVDPNILSYMTYSSFQTSFPIRNMILGTNVNGKPESFTNPFYIMPMLNNTWFWECTFTASNFRKVLNGRPAVIYPEVTVYYGEIDENGNYSPEKTTGKTVYTYDVYDYMYGEYTFFEAPRYYKTPFRTNREAIDTTH